MTNIYALQNVAMFKPTTATEIHQLFGLHMYMGINKLPRLQLYWSPLMGLEVLSQYSDDAKAIQPVAEQPTHH
jgi:hypothetical protein